VVPGGWRSIVPGKCFNRRCAPSSERDPVFRTQFGHARRRPVLSGGRAVSGRSRARGLRPRNASLDKACRPQAARRRGGRHVPSERAGMNAEDERLRYFLAGGDRGLLGSSQMRRASTSHYSSVGWTTFTSREFNLRSLFEETYRGAAPPYCSRSRSSMIIAERQCCAASTRVDGSYKPTRNAPGKSAILGAWSCASPPNAMPDWPRWI
jgi:hypothetical protein